MDDRYADVRWRLLRLERRERSLVAQIDEYKVLVATYEQLLNTAWLLLEEARQP